MLVGARRWSIYSVRYLLRMAFLMSLDNQYRQSITGLQLIITNELRPQSINSLYTLITVVFESESTFDI